MKYFAVILSGCGFLDGAEIRESVLTLLALDTQGAKYKIFAPDIEQYHVINHLKGEALEGQSRNVLEEAARIARGEIEDVAHLNPADFDGLVIPGGFGVAKNFSTFAFDGSGAKADGHLVDTIKAFKAVGKPIGAVCIAPALVALAVGQEKPTLTIGVDEGTAGELEKLGARHHNCETASCVVDEASKIVTTPAYMDGAANLADVYRGISKLVENVVRLA